MRLADDAITSALEELPGWTRDGEVLSKEYAFAGFRAAIAFIDRVAEKAHEAKHHPDLFNSYNRVIVSLTTHDEGGITEQDVGLARAIESVAAPTGP